jgi:hypothetical protein
MERYTLVVALAAAVAQQAWPACGNATLRGTYGLDGGGAIYGPPELPVAGPFVRVGAVHFDGAGGVRYDTVSSYNGIVTDEPYVGAYSVDADCRFVYKAVLPPPINLPVTFSGFASDNGNRLDYMLVDPPGAGVHATLLRQPQGRCSSGDLAGTYTMISRGVLLPPHPDAGPFVRVGTMTASSESPFPSFFPPFFSGPGKFTITANANYAGLNRTETLNGTYSVEEDCKVRFDYTQPSSTGNVPSIIRGILVDGNKQIIFMIAVQGVVVSGTMTRQ